MDQETSNNIIQIILQNLSYLKLKFEKFNGKNGVWYVIKRIRFDLWMLEEPHSSLILLVSLTPAEYIFRVLGVTRERGCFSTLDELQGVILTKFEKTIACVGSPTLRSSNSVLEVTTPFNMLKSTGCKGYYRVESNIENDENILQGKGLCSVCKSELASSQSYLKISKTLPEEDVSFNCEKLLVSERKKPGRPKTKVSISTKKRKMSDETKEKISANNKIFSICKICHLQCRGFRGLVDHMHRAHPDFKPWKCGHCDERTAFVKTLYRHLKQAHNASASACPICGKIYTRAQSMLHHVNKHQLDERKICQQNFLTKKHFPPDYTIENPKLFESTKKAYLPSGDLREEIIDSTKLHPSSDESTEKQKRSEPTKNYLNSDDIREEPKNVEPTKHPPSCDFIEGERIRCPKCPKHHDHLDNILSEALENVCFNLSDPNIVNIAPPSVSENENLSLTTVPRRVSVIRYMNI